MCRSWWSDVKLQQSCDRWRSHTSGEEKICALAIFSLVFIQIARYTPRLVRIFGCARLYFFTIFPLLARRIFDLSRVVLLCNGGRYNYTYCPKFPLYHIYIQRVTKYITFLSHTLQNKNLSLLNHKQSYKSLVSKSTVKERANTVLSNMSL